MNCVLTLAGKQPMPILVEFVLNGLRPESSVIKSFILEYLINRKCESDYPVTSWLPCPPLLNMPDCTSNTLNGQLGRLPLACFPDIGPFANIMPVSNVMKMPSYHRSQVSNVNDLTYTQYDRNDL